MGADVKGALYGSSKPGQHTRGNPSPGSESGYMGGDGPRVSGTTPSVPRVRVWPQTEQRKDSSGMHNKSVKHSEPMKCLS